MTKYATVGPRKAALALAALAVAGLVAGCGSSTPATSARPATSASAFPVTVGGVTLSQRPTHIVSLTPTGTEMLFAIGAGSQVAAVDDQSNYPAGVPKTNLSGYQPDAEAIAAKSPDLVVISEDINDIKQQLTKLKVPVYVMPAAATLNDSYTELTDLGRLTDHQSQAANAVTQMKDGIASLVKDVPKRTKPLTYYYELDQTYYSATSKTFIGSLFSMVGLTNIADPADTDGKAGGYPQLSAESIVKANPDLIFLADTKCCQQSASTVAARPGWSGLSAVRDGRVVALDDDIASRWGPRVVNLVKDITDAVEKVPAS
ncbi:ABC transporter substrate-binding protein [Rugosimonospora acidiphila]|uniref:ABC transporter substrate-binding protein n=1 Tax=Rugosimonospora acidiphila TaxID=556531 RepID=A0ABP9RHF6_9ACTN